MLPLILVLFTSIFLLLYCGIYEYKTNEVLTLFCLVILLCLAAIFTSIRYDKDINFSILVPYVIGIFGCYLFLLLNKMAENFDVRKILYIINIVVCIHVTIFFLQLSCWLIGNVNLDFSTILGGSGNRPIGNFGVYRPTGIFDEPGIYGLFVFSLFIIRFLIVKRFFLFDFFIFISLVLTQSMYSYVLIGCFLFWCFLFYYQSNYKYFLIFIILILGIVITTIWIVPRLELIIAGEDYSTNTKLGTLSLFLDNSINYFLGLGLLPVSYWITSDLQAIGDMTFILSTLVIYGIPIGILIILCIMYLIMPYKPNKYTILILIPFIKLVMLNWLFFWVYLALARIAFKKASKLSK